MISNWKIHYVYVILLALISNVFAGNPRDRIYDSIHKYFQNVFESTAQSTDVIVGRISESFLILSMDKSLVISSQRMKPRLGRQTIWVEAFKGSKLIKKIPVNVDVTLTKKVLVAKNRINRHHNINNNNVLFELRQVDRLENQVCNKLEEIIGLQTTKVIPAGSIIYSKYLRKPPMIATGDQVKLKIKTNNLVITTNGIAKQEGRKGDKISVLCEATGKRLYGLVAGPNIVVLNRE
jgi:flagella basal body P-ring formation protein FlgA